MYVVVRLSGGDVLDISVHATGPSVDADETGELCVEVRQYHRDFQDEAPRSDEFGAFEIVATLPEELVE